MNWQEILNNALKTYMTNQEDIEKATKEITEAINAEIPKHYVEKEKFDSTADELKAANTKMAEMEGKIGELSKSSDVNEELKTKLEQTQQEFAQFKVDTEKRENNRKKSIAIEKNLRLAGAAEDSIDLLIKEFDIESITLDQEGKIVDWDTKLNDLKTKRKSLFTEVSHETDKPGDQKTSETKKIEEMSTEEYYKSINMKPFNQAIRG